MAASSTLEAAALAQHNEERRSVLRGRPAPAGKLGRLWRRVMSAAVPSPLACAHLSFCRSAHRFYVWQAATVGYYMLDRFEQALMVAGACCFFFGVFYGLYGAASKLLELLLPKG
jgi:hypothetical protein